MTSRLRLVPATGAIVGAELEGKSGSRRSSARPFRSTGHLSITTSTLSDSGATLCRDPALLGGGCTTWC